MVIARALFAILAGPLFVVGAAQAQVGGIQVAPVMISMSPERSIASFRVRNGRERPAAFEVDVYAWTQTGGRDVLTPTADLLAAPGVFEIPAGQEQVLRLGAVRAGAGVERAFRIILRELPGPRHDGAALGFTLEMSLPIFVSPTGARANLETHVERRGPDVVLVLANSGAAHVQLAPLEIEGQTVPAPRYLLAGARAEIALPAAANTIQLRAAELGGAVQNLTIHVNRQDLAVVVR